MTYKTVNVDDAHELMKNNSVQVIDIRDAASYQAGHIEGAEHIDDTNLENFILEADYERPLLVYCFHGNMSQGAANYFAEKGFEQTYSLDGGFSAWQQFSVNLDQP